MIIKKTLHEWERIYIEDKETLEQINLSSDSDIIERLSEKNVLRILELKDKIQIESFAYVGRVQIGNLEISIIPKIDELPYIKLLDYVFDLNIISTYSDTSQTLKELGFIEILIYGLAISVRSIIKKGICKSYVELNENLDLYRGSVVFKDLLQQIATKSTKLPCRHFNRIENNLLNQVLLSACLYGRDKSNSITVKNEFLNSTLLLRQFVNRIDLNEKVILDASRQLNRLNDYYVEFLRILHFLYTSAGIFLQGDGDRLNINGFLLNMNKFFQELLTKFLKENVEGFDIVNEPNIKEIIRFQAEHNPKRSKNPVQRPDFALIKGGKTITFMDAKYIDLWNREIPSYILYQIAMYAQSLHGDIKTALVFYPAVNGIPVDSALEIKHQDSINKQTNIIFRPVNMLNLSELVGSVSKKRIKDFVHELISMSPH